MPRTARRRRQTNEDNGVGLLALVIGAVLYRQLSGLAWQWKVALVVLVASLALVVLRWTVRFARRRQRQRLMLTDALSLSPSDFERRIQYLLQDLGWESVERVGGSGDGGVDLRGVYRGQRCIVQCKRYRDRVEPKYIRDLEGARHHEHADRAFLITTGRFTDQGREWVHGKPIELWDGAVLATKFYEQQVLLQQPAIQQQERRRTMRFLGSVAAINLLVLGWASVTAEPVPFVAANQVPAMPSATAIEIRTSQASQAAPTNTPAASDTCGQATISGVERLVLRVAPGLQTERLNDYPAGTTVTMLCTTPVQADALLWQQVRVENAQGWMSKRFLK